MKVTREKNCFCHTCEKAFHYLGITRHRTMHKERKEDCTITYTWGDTYAHKFSKPYNKPLNSERAKVVDDMKTNIEKCKDLFESISCLCCEGPEFMTTIELMRAIGKDAGKGYDLCARHLSSEQAVEADAKSRIRNG